MGVVTLLPLQRRGPPKRLVAMNDAFWVYPTLRTALTFLVAVAGGVSFSAIGAPAPWLTGSAAAVGCAAIAGAKPMIPAWLRYGAVVFLGSAVGSTMTPQTVGLLLHWPISFIGLAVSVFGIMAASSIYLERVHGYDRATARLASVPGALPYVLALAAEGQGDKRRIIIVQLFRLTVLLLLIPIALSLVGHADGSVAPRAPGPVVPGEIVALLAVGSFGTWIFERLRVPAAPLCGAMVASAIVCGSGILSPELPRWLMVPAFVIVGAVVGANFASVDRYLLLETFSASLGSLAIGAIVALLCALPMAWLLDVPSAKIWLAYAPGGADAMTIMAIALGVDPAFVGGHHVARFLGLGLFVPFWMRNHTRSRNVESRS